MQFNTLQQQKHLLLIYFSRLRLAFSALAICYGCNNDEGQAQADAVVEVVETSNIETDGPTVDYN